MALVALEILRKIEEISERSTRERETWHEERESYIKEIAMIRLEERNAFIRQIQKILNDNNGIKSTQTKNNRGRKKSS